MISLVGVWCIGYTLKMSTFDDRIHSLNELVSPSLSADVRTVDFNMKDLSAAIHSSQLGEVSSQVDPDTGEPCPTLPGHMLIHANALLALDWDDIWIRLQGGGPKNAWANTVFGNLNEKLAFDRCAKVIDNPRLVDDLRDSETVPVSIVERLVLSLRILSVLGVYSAKPEATKAAQQCLSEVLLSYPVLMHPKILVPVYRKGVFEYANVLHALAGTTAGLPRRSHFGPDYKGANLDERLKSFASHPCVTLALRQQTSAHVTVDLSPVTIKTDTRRLVTFGLNLATPRVQFIASVLELDEFAQPGVNIPMNSWYPKTSDPKKSESNRLERNLLMRSMAASFFASTGLTHSSSKPTFEVIECLGRAQSTTCFPLDSDFLVYLNKSSPVLVADQCFMNSLRDSMSKRIFSGRTDDLGAVDVQANTQALISGLTAAGITKTKADAAVFIVDAVLGQARVRRQLPFPKADSSSVLAFIECIAESGGFGEANSNCIDLLLDVVKSQPNYVTPYRDQWSAVLGAFGIERVMRDVISRARADSRAHIEHLNESDRSVTPVQSVQMPADTPRRRRVTV